VYGRSTAQGGMTSKDEIAKAVAAMVAEQIRHGASAESIAALVKLLTDDQEAEPGGIPDA
jgi:hypothetical protein